MAAATLSHRAPVLFRRQYGSSKKKGSEYLESAKQFVVKHKDEHFHIKKLPKSCIKITPLEGTIYRDQPKKVNGWGKFYLPKTVKMQVLGVVEGTAEELVLMTCEDKRLFICDGEELHVVGRGLDQVKSGNIMYPSDETYYKGQAFKNMTEEDWEKVKRGPVGQKLDEEHNKLVETFLPSLLENLKSQK